MSVNGTLTTKFNRGSKITAKHDRDHDKRWNVQILEKKIRKNFIMRKISYVLKPNYEILSNNKFSILIGQHFRLILIGWICSLSVK